MRLAWLTDIHLNFVDRPAVDRLAHTIRAARPDRVLLGGDIGEADSVCSYLVLLTELLPMPIDFVLGNHDFYRGSVTGVRVAVEELTRHRPELSYLSAAAVKRLTPRTALVGHDGWGDGGYGNAIGSDVELNDNFLIDELRDLTRPSLLDVLRRLGAEAADHLRRVLPLAFQDHEHVIVLTHVPPFQETAWHRGRASDDDWAPFFACRAVGDVLWEVMTAHPSKQATVLCGHTHGSGECRVLPNLFVVTGGTRYGAPKVQRVIEVD